MSTPDITEQPPTKPRRADAQRNYDKVVAAAREAFTETGASTSLEEIARRAGVGIGTLYRHFPNRQALLEAVYVGEVEDLARSVAEFDGLPPWDAFVAFLHRFVGYMATKQALAAEMLDYVDRDAAVFQHSRAVLFAAGEPLIARAQAAKVVRPDTNLSEVIQLLGGCAKVQNAAPGQIEHLVDIAIDGLRYREPGT